MKKVGLLILVVGLSACAGPKPGSPEYAASVEKERKEQAVKTAKSTVDEAPSWFLTPPTDADAIYASASEVSSDMQMALDKAVLSAKRSLAGQVGNRMSSKMKEFVMEVGAGSDMQLSREIERVTQNVVTDVNLAGFRREQTKVITQGGNFRAYVLLKYPMGDTNKMVVSQLKKSSALEARVRASKAFQDLEKEIEAARAKN